MNRLTLGLLALSVLGLPLRAQGVQHVVEGRVEFVTSSGDVLDSPSGTMTLWTHPHGSWNSIDAPIDRGRFRAELPHTCTTFEVGRAVIEGREAWSPLGPRRPNGGDEFTISFSEPRATWIEIVDTAGNPLDGVQVRAECGNWTPVSNPYAVPLVAEADSACCAPRTWIGVRAWSIRARTVGTPGWLQRTLVVDPRIGGQRVVTLEPETIAKAPWSESLDRARDLHVALHVPAAWNATDLTLELQRRNPATGVFETWSRAVALTAEPIDPDWFTWRANAVPDGEWRAVVRPIPWYGSFTLAPDSPRDVMFSIPNPKPIRVAVIDGRNENTVENTRVSWHACAADHAQDLRGFGLTPGAECGGYSFTATEGDIVLRVEADGYETAFEHVRVLPRAYLNQHTVKLVRSDRQRIRIVAYEREGLGGLVPASEFTAYAIPVGFVAKPTLSEVSQSWVTIDHPGTYDIQVVPSADYETPKPVRIVFDANRAPTVRVRLVRR